MTVLHPLTFPLQVWNSMYFEKITLNSLGCSLRLCHSRTPCTRPSRGTLSILDLTGIHTINVDYCGCDRAPLPRVQLMRSGWWPATLDRPQTAVSFRLLKFFDVLTVESKVNKYDFHKTLSHLTCNTQTTEVKVLSTTNCCARHLTLLKNRYKEFGRCIREFKHIMMAKRFGRAHDPAGISGTPAGACAIECPACPLPGKNLPTGWKSELAKDK